jgi:DNA-binding CsgD family transcriptional regulator
VVRLVADGKTSKEIAGILDLREHTIRTYRKTLMKKLGINHIAGLTQLALSGKAVLRLDDYHPVDNR